MSNSIKNYGLPFYEVVELAEELGVPEFALESFFKLLQQQNIAYQNCAPLLRTIAKRYLNLLTGIRNFQSEDLQVKSLLSQTEQFLKQGEFDLAEELINYAKEKHLLVAKNRRGNVNQHLLSAAEGAAQNGKLKLTQIKYVEAAGYFQEAAEIVPAEFSEKLVYYLNKAGNAWQDANRYADAEHLYIYSLAISENTLGENHRFVATVLSNLAELYQLQGRDDEAEPLYLRVSEIYCQRSLAIFEQFLGNNHPTTQSARENLDALQANRY